MLISCAEFHCSHNSAFGETLLKSPSQLNKETHYSFFSLLPRVSSFKTENPPNLAASPTRSTHLGKTHFNQKNNSVQDSIRKTFSVLHDTWNTLIIQLNFKPQTKVLYMNPGHPHDTPPYSTFLIFPLPFI